MGEHVKIGIQVNHFRNLILLLEECAQDLRVHVDAEYSEEIRRDYPTLDRRYRRDIGPAERAEAVVAAVKLDHPSIFPSGRQMDGGENAGSR